MGAGRATGFDDETTDLGSVSGRLSGPVEATKRVPRLQQMKTNSANNWRIRIPTSFQDSPNPAHWARCPRGSARSKMGSLRLLEQLIYHGFSDLERPSAWRKLSNRIACPGFVIADFILAFE